MDGCETDGCAIRAAGMYLCFNGQRNRLKILFFDGSGLWVCAKRLEKGRFAWPKSGDAQGRVVLSHEELSLLLGGIDLEQTRRRHWYRQVTSEAHPAA
jgi:transposase